MLNIGVPKETKGGRDKLGIWDSYIHTTIYKLEKQKTICYYKIYLITYNNLYWKITLKIVYIYIYIYIHNWITFLYTWDIMNQLFCCCSVAVSSSLWSHGLQHARPPCPKKADELYLKLKKNKNNKTGIL